MYIYSLQICSLEGGIQEVVGGHTAISETMKFSVPDIAHRRFPDFGH